MKLDERIAGHVAGTTLNAVSVKGFLQTSPHYHQWGVDHQVDQVSLDQLNATDLFEFYLRLYLTGRHKTMQAVLREVRSFVTQDAHAAHHLMSYSMEFTHQTLLTMEWYELLPRLEAAREQTLALAPNIDDHRRPFVINFLEESY